LLEQKCAVFLAPPGVTSARPIACAAGDQLRTDRVRTFDRTAGVVTMTGAAVRPMVLVAVSQ
jgi:hypothetical protein